MTVLTLVSSLPRRLQSVVRGAISLSGGFQGVLSILTLLDCGLHIQGLSTGRCWGIWFFSLKDTHVRNFITHVSCNHACKWMNVIEEFYNKAGSFFNESIVWILPCYVYFGYEAFGTIWNIVPEWGSLP